MVLGREWNGRLLSGEGAGSRSNLVVMDRPRSFVEVFEAEASKFVPAMAAASTTVQDSSAQMHTSAHQGEIKQRINEFDKIISKLEDVGDPALADLVAARKAENETLRGRLQEYKPTSQRLKLAQDARDKAARTHRQVGEELEALRLLLDAKAQAWREATLALELAQQEADTWQASAVTMPMHGMCPGAPQLWAAGLAAALPPEVATQFQSWLGSVSPDAMGHQLLENADDGLECEVDVLDAQSNSASSVLSPSASSRAAPAFAPFRLPLKEPAGILLCLRFFVAQ